MNTLTFIIHITDTEKSFMNIYFIQTATFFMSSALMHIYVNRASNYFIELKVVHKFLLYIIEYVNFLS